MAGVGLRPRVRCSSSLGPESVRYIVGAPGAPDTVRYSYGVKRYAVDTVWLHATSLFHPMLTTGEPISEAPATL